MAPRRALKLPPSASFTHSLCPRQAQRQSWMESWRASNPTCSFYRRSEAQRGYTTPLRSHSDRSREKASSQPRPFSTTRRCRPAFSRVEPSELGGVTVREALSHSALWLQAPGEAPASLYNQAMTLASRPKTSPTGSLQDHWPTSILLLTSALIHPRHTQQLRAAALESKCLGSNPVFPGCLSEILDLSEP